MSRPFRLTAPTVPETDLHAAVADALDVLLMPPAMWASYPAGHIQLPPAAAAKLSRIGLKRGIPDVLVWHGGQTFGIELKADRGRLSRTRVVRTRRGSLRILEGQTDVFPRLEAAGMQIGVCSSVDAVLHQLAAWCIPLRRSAA